MTGRSVTAAGRLIVLNWPALVGDAVEITLFR